MICCEPVLHNPQTELFTATLQERHNGRMIPWRVAAREGLNRFAGVIGPVPEVSDLVTLGKLPFNFDQLRAGVQLDKSVADPDR